MKYYNSQIAGLEAENRKKYENKVAKKNKFAYVDIYDKYLNNIPQSEEITQLINDLELKLGAISGNLDYGHQIKKITDQPTQRECWIIRLQILIRILLDITVDVTKLESNINLQEYKLGIFGSNKPTSDIDIGIQYTALGQSNLSQLLKIIEDKFVYLGYSTLTFDIEFYGDLLTITKLTNYLPVEYLYLSNSAFDCQEFMALLSYCGASIYRNFLHKVGDTPDTTNKNTQFFQESFLEYCEKYITTFMASQAANKFDNTSNNLLFSLLRTCVKNSKFTELFDDVKTYMYSEGNIKVNALQNFNAQRAEYYRRIALIEQSLNNRQDLLSGNVIELSNEKILELIAMIGNALIYRDESYVCVPTIIHVVRIMQAKSANAIPKMGNYGYLISILEQFGYLFRFDGNDANEANKAKFEKYNQRLIDALQQINISAELDKCIAILPSANAQSHRKRTIKLSVRQRSATRSTREEQSPRISSKRRRSTSNLRRSTNNF